MIDCYMCRGTGRRWTGWSWVECVDCRGTGRVNHCVACNGTGKLWLGGSDYIDCPECPNSQGAATTPKHYFFMGRAFEPRPIGG